MSELMILEAPGSFLYDTAAGDVPDWFYMLGIPYEATCMGDGCTVAPLGVDAESANWNLRRRGFAVLWRLHRREHCQRPRSKRLRGLPSWKESKQRTYL